MSQRPRVGAIRWDAWHGDRGGPGRAVQRSLGPREWHARLPFYARVLGDDRVEIDGSRQEVTDREIEYARRGGLDHWAFLAYEPDDPMSLGLKRYLASPKRDRLRFCLATELGRWGSATFRDHVAAMLAEKGYVTVAGGRPLLYLGFLSDETVRKGSGGPDGLRAALSDFRKRAAKAGSGDPYLVILDFDPAQGQKWAALLGADAISSYATEGGGKDAPYAALAAHAEAFWERCKATGAQVVPIAMTGWDRRPRVDRPVPWETWQEPGVGRDRFYRTPTPAELAAHVGKAVRWIERNPDHAGAGVVLTYAWNENDEGGWLVPTLSEGTARLDALAKALAS